MNITNTYYLHFQFMICTLNLMSIDHEPCNHVKNMFDKHLELN